MKNFKYPKKKKTIKEFFTFHNQYKLTSVKMKITSTVINLLIFPSIMMKITFIVHNLVQNITCLKCAVQGFKTKVKGRSCNQLYKNNSAGLLIDLIDFRSRP